MDANARVVASMNRNMMLAVAETAIIPVWERFESLYGKIGKRPVITLNGRIYRIAGRAWLEYGTIELSVKLFPHHRKEFLDVIIPHEAAHHVAFRLYEDVGHGPAWKQVMEAYGLPAKLHHSMELPE
jgi:SprT protein